MCIMQFEESRWKHLVIFVADDDIVTLDRLDRVIDEVSGQ